MNENTKITKSNKLIEARYKLSLFEQRLLFFMISVIKKDDKDFSLYEVKVKDLISILEVDGKKKGGGYNYLKRALYKLQKKNMIINEPDGDLIISWFSSAKYYDAKGTIDFEFSPRLKSYLLKLKGLFTTYRLENVIRLNSVYSIRVYELLKQYEGLGRRRVTLYWLKEKLCLEGKYKLYGDFKRRVLEVAKKDLPQKTDINFDYKEIKAGQRVEEIEFYNIRPNVPIDAENNQISLDFAVMATKTPKSAESVSEALILPSMKELMARGVAESQAQGLIEKLGDKTTTWSGQDYSLIDFQIEHFDWLKENGVGDQKPKKGTWLIKAIRENWQPGDEFKTKVQIEAGKIKREEQLIKKEMTDKARKESKQKIQYEDWLQMSESEKITDYLNWFKYALNVKGKSKTIATAEEMSEARKRITVHSETPEEYQQRVFGKVKFNLPEQIEMS